MKVNETRALGKSTTPEQRGPCQGKGLLLSFQPTTHLQHRIGCQYRLHLTQFRCQISWAEIVLKIPPTVLMAAMALPLRSGLIFRQCNDQTREGAWARRWQLWCFREWNFSLQMWGKPALLLEHTNTCARFMHLDP